MRQAIKPSWLLRRTLLAPRLSRSCRYMAIAAPALVYERNGEPEEVLSYQQREVGSLGDKDILVELIAVRRPCLWSV